MPFWRVPFTDLGLPADAPLPLRAAIVIADDDYVRGGAALCVQSAQSFELDGDRDDDVPIETIEGGLFDERIFGPLPRTTDDAIDLSAYFDPNAAKRPQLRRLAAIDLPASILHPLYRRRARGEIVDATGLDEATIAAILAGKLAMEIGGDLVPVGDLDLAPTQEVLVGAGVLAVLADRRDRTLGGVLRALPVLPPAMRPAKIQAGRLASQSLNIGYEEVIERVERARHWAAQETGGRELASTVADLQAYVDALLVDGFDAQMAPCAIGDRAAIPGLLAPLLGQFGAASLAALALVTSGDDLVLALRGTLYYWRTMIEAAALEVVLLDAQGKIDEAHRRTGLDDRSAHGFDDVYTWTFGRKLDTTMVFHGRPGDAVHPHIDVYRVRSEGGDLLLTAGMSSRPLPFAAQVGDSVYRTELVWPIPRDVERDELEDRCRALMTLAHAPFTSGDVLMTPGNGIKMRDRIWSFHTCEEAWAEELEDTLARHPVWLRVESTPRQ